MGVTRVFQGRLPEAIEYFQAAIHSQPDAPKAHCSWPRIMEAEPRASRLEEMRRALQLAPKDADIRADFGLALAWLGRKPEAIENFTKRSD